MIGTPYIQEEETVVKRIHKVKIKGAEMCMVGMRVQSISLKLVSGENHAKGNYCLGIGLLYR